MPARIEEIEHAREEGIVFNILVNPVKLHGNDQGWLTGVECIRMELGEPDDSGRRRPVPVHDSNFVMEADTFVVAIGNGPNPLVPRTTKDIQTTKWGNIIADKKTAKTTKRGVFAGGDIVLGAATVILAMGEGRRAARAIHEYLTTGEW
jgi:glutamate synthase (NADPH/NADH) small chain